MLCHSCPEGSLFAELISSASLLRQLTSVSLLLLLRDWTPFEVETIGLSVPILCPMLASFHLAVSWEISVWKPAQLKNWLNQRQEESSEKFKTTLQKTLTISNDGWESGNRVREACHQKVSFTLLSLLYNQPLALLIGPILNSSHCCIFPLMFVRMT